MTTKKPTRPQSEAAEPVPAEAAPKAPARRRGKAAPPAALAEPETSAETAAPPAVEHHKKDKKEKDKDRGKDKTKEKEKSKDKRKKHKKNKEAVIIRFQADQLVAIDDRAAELGLSRAAWVRMVVAKALGKRTK